MKRGQLLLSALVIATIGVGLLAPSSWLQGESTPSLRIEEEDLTPNAMRQLIPLFKQRNLLLLFFLSPNQLFVPGPGKASLGHIALLGWRTTNWLMSLRARIALRFGYTIFPKERSKGFSLRGNFT